MEAVADIRSDPLTYTMCVEELSKVCATTGVIVSAHTSLCIDPIMTYGTEEQKKKYVTPLAKGEKLGAFGLTEPGAGTDAAMQILILAEGDLAPVSCLQENAAVCERAAACRTLPVWEDYYKLTKDYFRGITLEDLMRQQR